MHIVTKLNTVFILVGPTMCGKTTFSTQLVRALQADADKYDMLYQISTLSSDNYRRYLLGDQNSHPHSAAMLEVSAQAFSMLFNDLKSVTSFPVNHDFVIIDTTGMNEKFRDDVRKISEDNGYNVELIVFEYDRTEALKGLPSESHAIVSKSLSKMKKEVLCNLKSSAYAKKTKIQKRDENLWQNLTAEVRDGELISKCILDLDVGQSIAFIGDTHEHVEALTELLKKLNAIDPNLIKVHVGDYLDKGGNTEEMMHLIYKRAIAGDKFLVGNHEAYIVRRLRGEIEPNTEVEAKYLTSIQTFLEKPELRDMLFDVYDNYSIPFLKVTGSNIPTLYATHAPCEEIYLGKLSSIAKRNQRNLSSKDRSKDFRHDYGFIFEQADKGKPLHVFGHVAHSADIRNMIYKSKIFLDTGAVYGNKLTAMIYRFGQPQFVQVDAKRLDTTDSVLSKDATQPIYVEKPFHIQDYDLDVKELRFVNSFVKKGIKFISGTMAPAPSVDGKLESLEAGLDYFRQRGIEQVVVEPKYMGSRCQLYLFKDPEKKSFAVSRNGFIINPDRVPGLTELLNEWLFKVADWEEGNWKEIILDGELLPWSALGKGLIEEQFHSYGELVSWELNELTSPELGALEFNTKPNLDKRKEDIGAFFNTLALYDKELGNEEGQVPLEFKAFATLSVDGVVRADEDPALAFAVINSDYGVIVDLSDENDTKLAQEFFDKLTIENGMEGVVIKPRLPFNFEGSVVPYLKVRNEEYLRLVYGYDYHRRYLALCRQKNIHHKARISSKEWELGKKMLTAEGKDLTEQVVKMISQLREEKTLDPRL